MNIRADKNIFLKLFNPALCAVSTKNTLTALECLYLNAKDGMLTVTAYDLNKGVKISGEVEILEEGGLLVSAVKLNAIVRSMPDGIISISCDKDFKCKIQCGKSRFEIAGLDPKHFPSLPDLFGDRGLDMTQGTFKKLCHQTLFSVSVTDAKPVLLGVLFTVENGVLSVVSCDGFRLSIKKEKVDASDITFLVPGKNLGDMIKLLDDNDGNVHIEVARKYIIFNFNGMQYFSRLVEGEYIDYKKSMPKSFMASSPVSLSHAVSICERCSLIIDERAKSPVKFHLEEGRINVTCSTVNGVIEDELSGELTGNNMLMGFNNRYICDAFRGALLDGEDEAMLYFNDNFGGICIQPKEGDGFYYLILPVRLNEPKN